MATAARNFSYGDGEKSHEFFAGDEVPEEIAEDIPNNLILEKLADENPGELDRDQLMRLAGVGPYAEGEEGYVETEFDEDSFREALSDFPNKGELVSWALEMYGLDLDEKNTRSGLEDAIIAAASGAEEE